MLLSDISDFFDRRAAAWDEVETAPADVVSRILDLAGIRAGIDVLDVACGTGVLFPYYRARRVGSLTGIDLAPGMVREAKKKFPDVPVLCGNVMTAPVEGRFDAVMLYNALPHFPDPAGLVRRLAGLLRPGGRLTIAHGSSRAEIDRCHEGAAHGVSMHLLGEDELAALFRPYCSVDVCISDEEKYVVSGVLRLPG